MKVGTKCPCMSHISYDINIIDSFAILNERGKFYKIYSGGEIH